MVHYGAKIWCIRNLFLTEIIIIGHMSLLGSGMIMIMPLIKMEIYGDW